MSRHVIAPVDELPPGSRKFLVIDDRPIAIFNVKGEFFGLLNRCPHQGAALCEGPLIGLAEADTPGDIRYTRQGEILRCPWHGWEYDIRTGQSWYDPRRVRVRAYEVSVEPGATVAAEADADPAMAGMAKGPYVVETFPVSVEERYVVVEV
jgi:nitrite reductase/ring-hydroxylating ferredoxin subunit